MGAGSGLFDVLMMAKLTRAGQRFLTLERGPFAEIH